MKKVNFRILVFAIASLLVWGCKNDEKNSPAPQTSKKEEDYKVYSRVNNVFNGVGNNVNKAYEDTAKNKKGQRIASTSCPAFNLTFNSKGNPVPGMGENYTRITLDYNGSQCDDGVTRNGQIIIYFSGLFDSWKDSVVLNNFFSDGVLINGYRASRFNPAYKTSNINPYDVKIDGSITFAGGESYHYSSTELHKYVNWFTGAAFIERTGKGALTDNRNNYTIYGSVTNPLITKASCSPPFIYAVSGSIDYSNNVSPGVKASVNYGNGACDKIATYMSSDGKSFQFLMD